jgi:hypothetical protein
MLHIKINLDVIHADEYIIILADVADYDIIETELKPLNFLLYLK